MAGVVLASLAERFEAETGNEFDADGPGVEECPYCGGLTQYASDHDCYGTRGEDHDAQRMEG
jgi:hypothetical protein